MDIDEYGLDDSFEGAVFRRDNDDDDIVQGLTEQLESLRDLAYGIANFYPLEEGTNDVCHNLIMRSAAELSRLRSWLHEDVETLAWCARNLLWFFEH